MPGSLTRNSQVIFKLLSFIPSLGFHGGFTLSLFAGAGGLGREGKVPLTTFLGLASPVGMHTVTSVRADPHYLWGGTEVGEICSGGQD